MNTHGTDDNFLVMGDSAGLIALLHGEDKHFAAARATVEQLLYREARVVLPLTAIVETVTTFQRKLSEPRLAAEVVAKLTSGGLAIDPVDEDLLKSAAQLFDPRSSKHNTLFDAVVAAFARRRDVRVIFSFDRWYKKQGFTLASDFVLSGEKAA